MRRITTLLITALTLALTASFAPAAGGSPDANAPAPGEKAPGGVAISEQTIPGAGGTPLKAKVITPTERGDGPFPVLVMPTSWGMPNMEYVGAAARMAYESGYVVVSYTARGFWDSGGRVDVASPTDTADASRVIDWTIRNARGDPNRVGMAGISYGAGISLLTAAADKRVRAVSAMSGWADLIASLHPNRTVNQQSAEMLLAVGHATGRFGDDLQELERAYRENRVDDALWMGPVRSAQTKRDQLNTNGTAVMIANAWEDGIFPPSQMSKFFQGLNGPKRLMLGPGDHSSPELFGAAGMPNEIWDSTDRWFDHFLRGRDNGIDRQAPVQLKPINGGDWRRYPDWESVTGSHDLRYLGDPRRGGSAAAAPGPGNMPDRPDTGWRHRVSAGRPTPADSGTIMVSGTLQGQGVPVSAPLPAIDREAAGVWRTDPYPGGTTVSGTPRLHTTVTPSGPDTSLFAYLYDVGPSGRGELITHKPVSIEDAEPGRPRPLDLTLEPGVWSVPEGHRLALVIDTVDPRYQGNSERGTQVTFSSPPNDPSTLDIPNG